MSGLFLLTILLQAALIIHCIKTGRNTIWIWVLALLSFAGVIAYLAVELIPDLLGSRATRRAVKSMRRALDPEQDLRRLQDQARIGGGVDTQQRIAEELLRQGKAEDAIGVYRKILSGIYEHDPNLMLGLARAQFEAQSPAECAATLEALIRHNPEFKSADGHLLYTRALEASGKNAEAVGEYAELVKYYAGAEAAVRYAQLLKRLDRNDEARTVLQALRDHARVAPPHYHKAQSEWLSAAERELSNL